MQKSFNFCLFCICCTTIKQNVIPQPPTKRTQKLSNQKWKLTIFKIILDELHRINYSHKTARASVRPVMDQKTKVPQLIVAVFFPYTQWPRGVEKCRSLNFKFVLIINLSSWQSKNNSYTWTLRIYKMNTKAIKI